MTTTVYVIMPIAIKSNQLTEVNMVLDDDEILQLKDTLGDACEKAEGIRQLLFALHISDNIDDIIDHHSIVASSFCVQNLEATILLW